MREDILNFASACSVCAQAKVTHQPPQGLLQPLPIPHRPWSHIALDFITGLPPSNHNNTILTIIDRLSKAVHFIPLTKLMINYPLALCTLHRQLMQNVLIYKCHTAGALVDHSLPLHFTMDHRHQSHFPATYSYIHPRLIKVRLCLKF